MSMKPKPNILFFSTDTETARHENLQTLVISDSEVHLENSKSINPHLPNADRRELNDDVRCAQIVCSIWLALSIFLYACIAFPILPSYKVVLEEQDHKDFLNYTMELMEHLAPGSSQGLLIPSDWSPSLTCYEFFHSHLCREKKGLKRICYSAGGGNFVANLMEDIGNQIAEDTHDPSFSFQWSNAFFAAIKEAMLKKEEHRKDRDDAVSFINMVWIEMGFPSALKFWTIASFVLFLIDFIWEATMFYRLRSGDYEPSPDEEIFIYFSPLLPNLLLFLFELLTHPDFAIESLNHKVTRGGFSTLMSVWFVWLLVYLYPSIWRAVAFDAEAEDQGSSNSTLARHQMASDPLEATSS